MRIRFSENQRTVLQISWQRGFLLDNKHYGSISEITGLTRKQISNWARTKINKCSKECLPLKNPAPILTIFKELHDSIRLPPISIPQHIPQGLQHSSYNAGKMKGAIGMWLPTSCPQHHLQSAAFNPCTFDTNKHWPSQCTPVNNCLAEEQKLYDYGSGCDVTMQLLGNNVSPQLPRTSEPFKICSQNSNQALAQLELPTDSLQYKGLQAALLGINSLSDEQVDILAAFNGIQQDELRFWFFKNGWRIAPAATGLRYERILRADYQTMSSNPMMKKSQSYHNPSL